jgi:hypothetical protein
MTWGWVTTTQPQDVRTDSPRLILVWLSHLKNNIPVAALDCQTENRGLKCGALPVLASKENDGC